MQNLFAKAAGVSFKIWFFALLANTVIGAFILAGFKYDYFMYFIFGAMFGGVSSLPILFIFQVLLYRLFTNRIDYYKIIGWLFIVGILYSLAAFLCFTFWCGFNIGNVFLLCISAIISSIIGIASQIKSIKYTCEIRDNEFIIETTSSNK